MLAFSQPTLKGSYSLFGSETSAKIVIIIDDTFSMSIVNNNGEFLKQAKFKALEVVDEMRENDGALIIRLSELPNTTTPSFVYDKKRLKELINRTIPKYNHATIDEAFRVTAKLLSDNSNSINEVYIISDNQLSTLTKSFTTNEKLFNNKTYFFYFPINNNQIANNSIDTVIINNSILQPNKPVKIEATIKNYGANSPSQIVTYLSINGNRVQQELITIPENKNVKSNFTFTPTSAGFLQAKVEIENDRFEADDEYNFTINIPRATNVLYISNENNIIPKALATSTLDGKRPINFDKSFSSNLDLNQLSKADVLILVADNKLLINQIAAIQNFIEAGKGIIIIPSSNKENNQIFLEFLKNFKINSLPPIMLASRTKFLTIDNSHPIINGMFESENYNNINNFESPEFDYFFPIQSQSAVFPIVQLQTGTPFLSEIKNQKGKLLIFASPINEEFTDLTLKPLFVPLFLQSCFYAASSNLNQFASINAASNHVIKISTNEQINLNDLWIKIDQEKIKINNLSQSKLNNILVEVKKEVVDKPGFYKIESGEKQIGLISANINKLESDTKISTDEDVVNLFTNLGVDKNKINIISEDKKLASFISEKRNGKELWKECIIFAILLLFTESFVSKNKKLS